MCFKTAQSFETNSVKGNQILKHASDLAKLASFVILELDEEAYFQTYHVWSELNPDNDPTVHWTSFNHDGVILRNSDYRDSDYGIGL